MAIFLLLAVALFWLCPAIYFSIKICRSSQLSNDEKRRLILYCWFFPFIGIVICIILFGRISHQPPTNPDPSTVYAAT